MTIYEVALFVHIFGVVTWLGGSIMLLVIGAAARKATPERALDFFKMGDRAGNHLMPPAAILVVLSGIYMVIDAWEFSDIWVTAGMTMFILSLVAGIFFYSPERKRVAALADERGAADPEVTQRIGRYLNLLRIETLLLTVVVLLMVVKP